MEKFTIQIITLILVVMPLIALLYWVNWIVDSYQSKNKIQFRLSIISLLVLTLGPVILFLLIQNFEKFNWLTSSRAVFVWLIIFALAVLIPLYFASINLIKKFRNGNKWPIYIIYALLSLIILFSKSIQPSSDKGWIVWLSILSTLLIWPYYEYLTWLKKLYHKSANIIWLFLLLTPSILFAVELIKSFFHLTAK